MAIILPIAYGLFLGSSGHVSKYSFYIGCRENFGYTQKKLKFSNS